MTAHSDALRTDSAGILAHRGQARSIDVVASAIGLVFLAPVFAVIAVAIRLEDGGPVFYRQVRVGREGRPFRDRQVPLDEPAPKGGGSTLTIAGRSARDSGWRISAPRQARRTAAIVQRASRRNVLVGPRPETPDLMFHYTRSQRAVMVSRPAGNDGLRLAAAARRERTARARA